MAGTSSGLGHTHCDGAVVSHGGGAEPRRHAGGGSPRQRCVFLPLCLVPVHVPGELMYPAFLSPSWIAASLTGHFFSL